MGECIIWGVVIGFVPRMHEMIGWRAEIGE